MSMVEIGDVRMSVLRFPVLVPVRMSLARGIVGSVHVVVVPVVVSMVVDVAHGLVAVGVRMAVRHQQRDRADEQCCGE
jgi:hypothetical protein